jgi:hypothetical protein
VHVNRDLGANAGEIVSADMGAVLPKFSAVLAENPDLAYSRIVCPRKLEPNAPYHAFLLPVFESGRLAGLGLEPGHARAHPDPRRPGLVRSHCGDGPHSL